MFNVGGPEVLVILLVALIALGPAQLPQAARKVGQVMTEIRKVSSSFQRELSTAFEVEEAKEKSKEKPTSSGGPTDRTKGRTNGTEPAAELDDEPVEPDADAPDEAQAEETEGVEEAATPRASDEAARSDS